MAFKEFFRQVGIGRTRRNKESVLAEIVVHFERLAVFAFLRAVHGGQTHHAHGEVGFAVAVHVEHIFYLVVYKRAAETHRHVLRREITLHVLRGIRQHAVCGVFGHTRSFENRLKGLYRRLYSRLLENFYAVVIPIIEKSAFVRRYVGIGGVERVCALILPPPTEHETKQPIGFFSGKRKRCFSHGGKVVAIAYKVGKRITRTSTPVANVSAVTPESTSYHLSHVE